MIETHTLELHGGFTCSRFDIKPVAAQVADSKYNCIKTFLDGVVCQVPAKPVSPFTYDKAAGKFILKGPKIDNFFLDRLREWCQAIFGNGLFFHPTFLTQYHTNKSLKASKFKKHFLVHNDIGKNYSNDNRLLSVKPVYDSWVAVDTFHHIAWHKPDKKQEAKLEFDFYFPNAFAQAMAEYFIATCDVLSEELKKAGKGGIIWNLANECEGAIDIAKGETVQARSYGDRSEIHVFVAEQFERNGLVPNNKNFFSARNINAVDGTPALQDKVRTNMFTSITRKYGMSGGLGALMELHNDDIVMFKSRVQAIAKLSKKTEQQVLDLMIGSTDGSKYKKDKAKFIKDNKAFYQYCTHSAHLFEEGLEPFNPPVHPSRYDVNWNKYGDLHLKMVE